MQIQIFQKNLGIGKNEEEEKISEGNKILGKTAVYWSLKKIRPNFIFFVFSTNIRFSNMLSSNLMSDLS